MTTFESAIQQLATVAGVNAEELQSALAGIGGDSLETLAELTEGDIEKFALGAEQTKIPPLKARAMVRKLQELTAPPAQSAETPSAAPGAFRRRITDANASNASLEELLASYDPAEDNAARRRLETLANGLNPLLYRGTELAIPETVAVFNDIRNGEVLLEAPPVDGKPTERKPLGWIPGNVRPRHPLFGTALRSDGQDSAGRQWTALPEQTRQLLSFLVEQGALTVSPQDENEIWDLYELAQKGKIGERYSLLRAKFEGLSEDDRPRLTVKSDAPVVSSSASASQQAQAPFRLHREY